MGGSQHGMTQGDVAGVSSESSRVTPLVSGNLLVTPAITLLVNLLVTLLVTPLEADMQGS